MTKELLIKECEASLGCVRSGVWRDNYAINMLARNVRSLIDALRAPDEPKALCKSCGQSFPLSGDPHKCPGIQSISVPTLTMEQEFQSHYRRGYEAGKRASVPPSDARRWAFFREHYLDSYQGQNVHAWLMDNTLRAGGIDAALDELIGVSLTKSAACTCPGTFPPDPGCHYSNCPAGETSAAPEPPEKTWDCSVCGRSSYVTETYCRHCDFSRFVAREGRLVPREGKR